MSLTEKELDDLIWKIAAISGLNPTESEKPELIPTDENGNWHIQVQSGWFAVYGPDFPGSRNVQLTTRMTKEEVATTIYDSHRSWVKT